MENPAPILQPIAKQFGLFALVGVVGTAGHYAVLYGLVEWFGVGPVAASGWGALTGLVINYLLNHGFTFQSDQSHVRTFPKFALVASVGFALNLALMALLINRFGLYYLLAQVLVTAMVLVWNFLGNRFWTFHADGLGAGGGGGVAASAGNQLWRSGQAMLLLLLLLRLVSSSLYPLIDPTESRYAEMARKMLETGNWITPQIDYGVPFWGKPPLAVWLNAIDLGLFGINEFAVRLSAFLLSIGVLALVYRLALARGGRSHALMAVTILFGMVLFFTMAGSVAMDQCMVFGITLAMASFWLALQSDGRPIHGYGFFLGLAIGLMSKGPVAVILVGLPIGLWTLSHRQWSQIWRRLPWIKGTCLLLALSVPWYLIAEHRTPGFLEYFFVGEHWKRFTEPGWKGDLYGSGRSHSRGFIWVYWLVSALPWSLVFLAVLGQALWRKEAASLLASTNGWRQYCLLWMISPLLFFTLSANVIWTYVLPGLPGCALLIAEWRQEGKPWVWRDGVSMAIGSLVPGLFFAAVLAWAGWQGNPFSIVRSQKLLVEQYLQLRVEDRDHLYYLRETPFSAQFYTRGKARLISNVEEFQQTLENPGQEFFVHPRKFWSDLPDFIKDRLQEVGDHGDYMLLRRVERN